MTEPLDLSTPERPKATGLWGKLKRGLNMTHTELIERIGAAASGRGLVEPETLEDLEEALIAADLGVETSMELIEAVRQRVLAGQGADVVKLREMLVDEVSILLLDAPRFRPAVGPRITLVVGVNGAGKTTSIAKLAHLQRQQGKQVLLAAADTFRAAAIEQLVIWGDRVGVDVVRHQPGSDPAAVVFDAVQAARARDIDHVIVDTAGRLHTKSHLMEELAKIRRVINHEAPERALDTLLVLDATTGQNAVTQAKEFSKSVAVDGVFLSKLDGSAKGGVVVAVARELRLPVVYLGVGEGADDIVDFRARDFASALFG